MLLIGFLIYIPIGLGVSCLFGRLSMRDCVGRESLSLNYCEGMRRDSPNQNETYLWDNTPCLLTNSMRSGAQFCCIVLLTAFTGSTFLDFRLAERESAEATELAPASPAAHIAGYEEGARGSPHPLAAKKEILPQKVPPDAREVRGSSSVPDLAVFESVAITTKTTTTTSRSSQPTTTTV